ncbi:RHS repeat domain-containing protein [Pseudomonas putida]|uniref:RHS repeat domain-containing protein n=1 Tax=Pseudomonas putida TaxID=303 RepID=UPI00265A071A|nr:RHS repeat-associated core domain-containing protein [Pseudomonas putida]MCZ9636558.1 hypothetical protein [Pseudomonas putida]
MSQTAVHSNAFNFLSFLQNSVDPRTGQYTLAISLPELVGNYLIGPSLPLRLAFNPLNVEDSGFGKGWDLALTQYVVKTRALSLHTGESFTVDGSGPTPRISEKKIDSFHFHDDGDNQYRVVHRSGLVERLSPFGPTNAKVCLPTRVFAPSGHWLDLEYQPHPQFPERWCLTRITDGTGLVLLALDYSNNTRVRIDLHPGHGATPGAPRARYELRFTGREVTEVVLPTEEQASWRLQYRTVEKMTCLSNVQTPTGAEEVIGYGERGDLGHRLPGTDRYLPRVTSHVIKPGFGQPAMETRYTYTEGNFVGNASGIVWRDDGTDNLYRASADYRYGSTAEHYQAGKAVRTVTQTYNRHHLMHLQTTVQDGHIEETETLYHEIAGASFDTQPSYFQQPKTVTNRWRLEKNEGQIREETYTSLYHDDGTLKEEIKANGVRTVYEYYPKETDLQGFARNIKSQTLYPASAPGLAAARIVRNTMTYKPFDTLPSDDSDTRLCVGEKWEVLDAETLVEVILDDEGNEVETITLQESSRKYLDKPDTPFLHGRADYQSVTLHSPSATSNLRKAVEKRTTRTQWHYKQIEHPDQGSLVQLQQTTQGFDLAEKTITNARFVHSGELAQNEDIHGVQALYAYDGLGRLVCETVAPTSTDYAATRYYRYTLLSTPAAAGMQAYEESEDLSGVVIRTYLDGLGRTERMECETLPLQSSTPLAADRVTNLTYRATYDELGRLTSETEFDYVDEQTLALTSHFEYDAWGERCKTTRPDNVELISERSPFGKEGDIIATWLQCPAQPGLKQQYEVKEENRFGAPEQVHRLDEEQVVGRLNYFYDGLGRCIREEQRIRDPLQPELEILRTTGYQFDIWGRMERTDRPGGTALSRRFAPHSTNELVTGLYLHPADESEQALMCEREFDGIERLTHLKAGPRSETFGYVGEQMLARTRTTAANRSFTYEHLLALTTQPKSITVSGGQGKPTAYEYDRRNGQITSASNDIGTRTYDYDDLGHLTLHTWTGQAGEDYSSEHFTSLRGRAWRREVSHGAEVPKVETRYKYDDLGRVCQTTQGALQADFIYNDVGLLECTLTTDTANQRSLRCEQYYDVLGRETRRTLTVETQGGPGETQTLSQCWRDDDQLLSRTLERNGTPVLTETFEYDEQNRLSLHECEGTSLPCNAAGRPITMQMYEFDDFDNLTYCFTVFDDGEDDRAVFTYYEDGSCRLKHVSHTLQPDYPTACDFHYDADGNMLNDEWGNSLAYDHQGRLTEVRDPTDSQILQAYRYDGHDHMVSVQVGNDAPSLRHFDDNRLSSTLEQGVLTQYLYNFEQPLALQRPGNSPADTRLLMADTAGSVLGECGEQVQYAQYSAYGETPENTDLIGLLGFNAEVRERALGWYLLGRGYRAYNPGLMRFHSPDSLDPEAAGVNPYNYCLGNPVNWTDPTGHQRQGIRDPYIPHRPEKRKKGIADWAGAIGMFVTMLTVAAFTIAFPPAGLLMGAAVAVGFGTMLAGLGLTIAGVLEDDPEKSTQLQALGGIVFAVGALITSLASAKQAWNQRQAAKAAASNTPDVSKAANSGATPAQSQSSPTGDVAPGIGDPPQSIAGASRSNADIVAPNRNGTERPLPNLQEESSGVDSQLPTSLPAPPPPPPPKPSRPRVEGESNAAWRIKRIPLQLIPQASTSLPSTRTRPIFYRRYFGTPT